jgi:hypothetical protein
MTAVFLLGAGFNADAANEAPASAYRYPMVRDLLAECFHLQSLAVGYSIEQLFQEAALRGDTRPMDLLASALTMADYDIFPRLCARRNSYLDFVDTFAPAQFLTFNYDSLLELLLFHRRLWRPEEGFGVIVEAELGYYPKADPVPKLSASTVLHLHGSLCLYRSEYHIRQRPGAGFDLLEVKKRPNYVFDPDAISTLFLPYDREMPELGYDIPGKRVIAPVPDKANELTRPFVREVYAKAIHAISAAAAMVAIGYSFSPNDRSSYAPLLASLHQKNVFVVSPNAFSIAPRMQHEWPAIRWITVNQSFHAWARAGFPLRSHS